MNPLGTGGIGLALNLQTRSKSAGQGNAVQLLEMALPMACCRSRG
jgi:hypothetical protein